VCCSNPFSSNNEYSIMFKRILSLLLVVITALFNLTGAVTAALMPAETANSKPAVQYVDWAAESISLGGRNRKLLQGEERRDGGRGRGGRWRGRGGRRP
jgi:hypothetical protein